MLINTVIGSSRCSGRVRVHVHVDGVVVLRLRRIVIIMIVVMLIAWVKSIPVWARLVGVKIGIVSFSSWPLSF